MRKMLLLSRAKSLPEMLRRVVSSPTSIILALVLALTILTQPISAAQSSSSSASATSATQNLTTTPSANQTQSALQSSPSPSSATPVQSKTSAANSNGLENGIKATPSNAPASKTNSNGQQQSVTIVEPQQSQSTDLSSMYVQIPIAEPGDTGVPDGVQQTLASVGDTDGGADSNGSTSKSSSWTGPWPKKFQIGYIKQSDLHQVLMESLKSDPFVSLASPSSSPSSSTASQSGAATKTSSSGAAGQVPSSPAAAYAGNKKAPAPIAATKTSDSASLMLQQQLKANPAASWPVYGSGQQQQQQSARTKQPILGANFHAHHQFAQTAALLPQAFRADQKIIQQTKPFQMHRYHTQGFNGGPQQGGRLYQNQQPAKHHIMPSKAFANQQQQQQQFQFAGFPSSSFKNQPMYTINNYPHHEQLDGPNSMQFLGPQQQQQQPQQQLYVGPVSQSLTQQQQPRATKSNEYYSSWRPVTNNEQQPQQQAQVVTGKAMGQAQLFDYQTNDAFDDGFNSPSKDADATGSMNRHPMLNNYLGSGNQAGSSDAAPAPATRSKMSPAMLGATKGKQAGGKAAQPSAGSTKGGSATKSAEAATTAAPDGVKGQQTKGDSGMELSAGRRRASNGTSTSTTSPSNSGSSTTLAPNGDTGSSAATTTLGSNSTTTTTTTEESVTGEPTTAGNSNTTSTQASTSPSTSAESETQEPDSEVIDSADVTENSNNPPTTTGASAVTATPDADSAGAASSTAASTVASADGSSTQTTISIGQQSTQPSSSDESEVATQAAQGGSQSTQQQQNNNLPAVPGNNDEQFTTQSSGSRSSAVSTTTSSTTTSGSMREETTPQSGASEPASGEQSAAAVKGNQEVEEPLERKIESMSDEALLAASVRTGAEIAKMNASGAQRANASTSKRTRSSERLVQQPQAQVANSRSQVAATPSGSRKGGKQAQAGGVKSASRSAKQVGGSVKGSTSSSNNNSRPAPAKSSKKRTAAASSVAAPSAKPNKSNKATRMAQQSERLQQQQPQVVSMSAAQAQSTAQTLASLLLSRCMSSSNCAHLLDMCTTKQAIIPLPSGTAAETSSSGSGEPSSALSAAWSMPVGLMSSGIMSLTQSLQADKVLKVFPQWKDAIENIVDHDTQTGYTLILPSNEAIERLPEANLDAWLANGDLLAQIIDNHLIDSSETIEFATPGSPRSRFIRSKGLQVNQHRDKMVTINGKRLVYANQAAPSGGRIHVIDGVLDWPVGGSSSGLTGSGSGRLLDIMDTLKQCDKFDGFVTLAEGTGLTQILKQDGPMTVFVPSNEALRKIPDEELEVIKNNSTALKEFLMYHVVNGSYFSQDLRDGQQIASILDMKPIQVGVRVDGCSRRLVEANTSPMRRPDIVAKNGVIHILDWYLTVRDNEWCDPIGRSTFGASISSQAAASAAAAAAAATAASSTNSVANTSERLQQLASDTSISYATRMIIPANHKPAPLPQLIEGPIQQANSASLLHQPKASSSTATMKGLETNSILVSATPFGESISRVASVAA